MLHEFAYEAPTTQKELYKLLTEHQGQCRILAGGTDLLVNIRNGVMKPNLVIDIKRIPEYQGITWDERGGLVLRPTTTINEVLRHPIVRDHFPLLQDCGHDLASFQVRNRATVIGNVVNASPCSDMAPALLCLGAKAVIGSARGRRSVPFKEFFTGVKRTVLSPDEVLEEIVIPADSRGARGSYKKLKRINGHDLGIIGVGIALLNGGLSIAVSSAAPTPVVVEGLPGDISIDDALTAVKKIINPISDVRCTKEYREFMVGIYVKRQLGEVRS